MLLVDSGGHEEAPSNCPLVLFDAIMKPCFARVPQDRPAFAVLSDMLGAVLASFENEQESLGDDNFPRFVRNTILPQNDSTSTNSSTPKKASTSAGTVQVASVRRLEQSSEKPFYSLFDFASAKVCSGRSRGCSELTNLFSTY